MNIVNKKYIIKFIRILIAVSLVYLVLKQVQWNDFVEIDSKGNEIYNFGIISSFRNLNLNYLLLSVSCIIIGKVIIGIRWHFILKVLSINVRIQEVVRLTFLSEFISLLLPGFLGGDLVKAYLVSKKTKRKTHTFASIFIDRIIGIAGFVFLAISMLIIALHSDILSADQLRTPLVSIGIILTIIIMGIILVFISRSFQITFLEKLFIKIKFMKYLHEIFESIGLLFNKKSLPKLIVLTLCAQILAVISVMFIGIGLSMDIHWYLYFLYVPLIVIISAVPLTPGGVGVMEELYLIYFVSVSNNNKVLLLAVLVRFTIMISNLPGFFVALLDKKAFQTNIGELRHSIE